MRARLSQHDIAVSDENHARLRLSQTNCWAQIKASTSRSVSEQQDCANSNSAWSQRRLRWKTINSFIKLLLQLDSMLKKMCWSSKAANALNHQKIKAAAAFLNNLHSYCFRCSFFKLREKNAWKIFATKMLPAGTALKLMPPTVRSTCGGDWI